MRARCGHDADGNEAAHDANDASVGRDAQEPIRRAWLEVASVDVRTNAHDGIDGGRDAGIIARRVDDLGDDSAAIVVETEDEPVIAATVAIRGVEVDVPKRGPAYRPLAKGGSPVQ